MYLGEYGRHFHGNQARGKKISIFFHSDHNKYEMTGFKNEQNSFSTSTLPLIICSFGLKGTHISSLPVEVLMYISKWVVSGELDVFSLEQLSRVSSRCFVSVKIAQLM